MENKIVEFDEEKFCLYDLFYFSSPYFASTYKKDSPYNVSALTPYNYLLTKRAVKIISQLKEDYNIEAVKVETVHNGNLKYKRTKMFSALYLDYAKWISNEFHLQEHKRIHEVLMDYMVSIYNIDTIDMKSSEILTIFGCL